MHRVPIDKATFYPGSNELLNSGSPNETMACLMSENGIFIFYNLFTGAAFVVKDAPMRQNPSFWICYGFGYDSHADDHKIFVACKNEYANILNYSGVQNAENSLFWIYSLGNKVWERLEGFSKCATYDMTGRRSVGNSLNGVLHWVFRRSGHGEEVIVTYDLHTSKFGEMLVPNKAYGIAIHDQSIHGRSGKVSQLNGLLCYSYTDMEDGGTYNLRHVVWVMNKYGVENSWQKLLSIDSKSPFREIQQCLNLISLDQALWNSSIEPAALHESEEGRIAVLFVCHKFGKMFWYGLKEGEIRVIDEAHLLKETRLKLKRKIDFVS